LAQWAFDPGTDLSTQLFYEPTGIRSAGGSKRAPECAQCKQVLGDPEQVTLDASVRLKGFEPIHFRTRLNGYICKNCGLAQAPPDSWVTVGRLGKASGGGSALNEAVKSIGLKQRL
jgi:hypothetical protein